MTYHATVILSDGSQHWQGFRSKPKHWKSVAMRLAPYGADLTGATLTLTRDSRQIGIHHFPKETA